MTGWSGAQVRRARDTCRPIAEAGGPCYRCRKPIQPGQTWHADHIIDRAQGGTDDPSNLWPSHDTCNTSAGGKTGARITNARRAEKPNSRGPSETARGIRGI